MIKRFTFLGLLLVSIPQTVSADVAHSPAGLRSQMAAIAQASKGSVGAAVMVVEDGNVISLNGQQHFPMQSVYKMLIAMAVLQAVDQGKLSLEQKVSVKYSDLVPASNYSPLRDQHPVGNVTLSLRDLLRYMIVESDGTACDVLLRLLGGPEHVTTYVRQLGVKQMVVATTEKQMSLSEAVQYQNWATPEAMVRLLRLLQDGTGVSGASRTLLLGLMIQTKTGPHRIKGLLPIGSLVAHKTGSSLTVNGLTRATNDVGLVTLPDGRHLAIAVFVSDTRADTATREAVIARIARAAWDFQTGQTGHNN